MFYQNVRLNFLFKHPKVKFQNTALSRLLGAGFLHKQIFPNFLLGKGSKKKTSTNVNGRLARTEFFNHFSDFF